MNDFNLTSIDEVIKTVRQYGTSSWIWENGEISKDALVCNIFPILEDAKQFEIELSEDEFRDIEEDYDTADNTYNYGCNISNELDWKEKKGVGCIVMVHLGGDVRGNYTDYFAVESMDDIFGLDSTFQPKEITDRYIADLNAFSEYYEVYDTVTQDNIGTCYEIDREDAIKWIKENADGDETVTEELKLREAVADENTQIWASDAEYDYVESLDRDTLLNEFDFVFEDLPDDKDINEYSDDELKEKVHDYDYDLDVDHEDLVEGVIPEIEKQCYDNMIWFVGNYQRWDGGHSVVGYFDDVEKGVESVCYPNYDARTVLYEDKNGNVCFTEYSHDAPTGGTAMTLYSFKDRDSFDKADEEDEAGAVYYDSEDPETVHGWIEKGYLTPIKWN